MHCRLCKKRISKEEEELFSGYCAKCENELFDVTTGRSDEDGEED